MSKRVIAVVRKDPKGRNLRPGEYYDEVKQRYKYRYRDAKGTYHDVYAFRLTDKDPVPYDKPEKYRVPLRELEKKVEEEAAPAAENTPDACSENNACLCKEDICSEKTDDPSEENN